MKDKDLELLSETYQKIVNPVEENLVLKRKMLDDGKYIFVVDSDLPDAAGRNETFKNKDKVKQTNLFFFDRTNLRKWVSKKSYDEEEFRRVAPEYKKAVYSINKPAQGGIVDFANAEEEIEDLTDIGAQDQITNFLDKLKKEVTENINSPEVKEFLSFRKKFRKYSFNNQMLIFFQKKTATHVAGRVKWEKEFGRKIKKGAKAIQIFIPIMVNREVGAPAIQSGDGDREEKIMRFKLGPVFDISDTEPIEGKEDQAKVPTAPKWYSDENVDETTEQIYTALEQFAKSKNITVTVDAEGLDGARGVSMGGSVQLLQKNISTMVHEIAHELLHQTKGARMTEPLAHNIVELQAEGVAYAVLEEFGLNSEHAAKYLALWKVDPENINQNQEVIRKTANIIIDYVYDYIHKDDNQPVVPESFKKFFGTF